MDGLVFCVLISTATITAIEAGNPTENGILVNNNSYYSYSIYTDGQAIDFLETLDGLEGTYYLGNATLTTAYLEFPFPFYGHLVRNLTVVKNGFLFMGRQLHQYLTASEYIAPLMADLTVSESQVKYRSFYNKFVAGWEDVRLTNKSSDQFQVSFQVILYANGTIAFVYKQIGLAISSIQQSTHPVKIGLSNAFFVLNKSTNRSSIYEYDRLAVNGTHIQTGNVIIFTPRSTCTIQNTCGGCVGVSNFNCQWCYNMSRCSDGVDWFRQQWLDSGCNLDATSTCTNQADNSGMSNTTQSPHHDDHTDVQDPGSSNNTAAPTDPPDAIAVTSHQDTSPRPDVTFPTTISPGDQLDLQIERIGSGSVDISWKPAEDSIFMVRYVVQLKTAATSWYNHTYGDVLISGNRRKATIEPLFESTVYNIRMYAYMALGRTGYTTVIAFQTTSSNTGGPTTSGDTSSAGGMTNSLTLTVFCASFVLYGVKKVI